MPEIPAPRITVPLVKRYHGLVRLTHWLNAILLVGLIGSGIRIYEAFPHFGWKGRLLAVPNPFEAQRFGGFPSWAKLGSSLAPALSWLVSPRLLATASLVIATALFSALIAGRFPQRATRVAAAWFALGASIALLSCRVPFDLGLAAGLGALLFAQRRRSAPALVLAALCALASPVAGGFLALAALAWWLALRPGGIAIWLAVAGLAPVALLALAFPEGGYQPFVASAFYPALLGVLAIAALMPAGGGRGVRVLRAGALLYALALTLSYVLRTPVGGNVDRLGALAAGPLAACALAWRARDGAGAWRGRALALLAPFLLYWQATAPLTD